MLNWFRRGPDIRAWLEKRRPVLYTTIGDDALGRLKSEHPAQVAATVASAEKILRHEFDLLGSATFVPVDPDRRGHDGYIPIDWYLDPVRKLRFPRGVPCEQWDLYKMRPANADIKYPWELARCQHWPVLGQAFRLTGDERFAREIANELDDFVAANPVGVGVNWTCAMDEAIRAVNWSIGLELIGASASLDRAFWERAYRALYDHGVFVRGHLENTYEVTSNHFLSDVVGLWFLGAVFADLDAGKEWWSFARTSLEREIDVQVLPDGADFESSIPYHRLVTELFLGALRLGEVRREPLSAHYRDRVRDMVAYLAAVLRPDGLLPQVGDADDGRLHVLTGYGTVSPQDGRHIFGPAGAIFNEPAWTCIAGSSWESAWWGLDSVPSKAARAPVSRLFADAGVAVMRGQPSTYLLVTNGIVGTNGFGNHKHNDQLSFEFHHGGVPIVVDAGSYVYTSDGEARNAFRGTAMHNTLQIDETEQNEIRPEWLFRMFETAHAEHVAFDERDGSVQYVGKHHGYERLSAPVTHERQFTLDKTTGRLEIVDRVSGRGEHALRWHFHLAPQVNAEVVDDRTVALLAAGHRWQWRGPAGARVRLDLAAYSPSYGRRVPCSVIDCRLDAALTGEQVLAFVIAPQ